MIEQQYTQSGKWYQPYIHSVPENFLAARNQYYRSWDLDSAIMRAERIAEKLFVSLEAYYSEQEYALADFLGIKHATLKNNIGHFMNNLSDIYEGKTTTGDYGFMSNIHKVLEDSKKIDDQIINNKNNTVAVIIKKWMDKKVQQIDPKAKVNPDRIKEAYAFVGEMTSVIENLIDNKEIQNPNELAQSVVLKLLLGERLPAGIGKEGKKVIQKLNKTNKAMIQFLKDIRSGVSPITEDKKRNAVPKIKTKTIKSAVATQLGFFNEDVITDILNSLVKSGANIVTDKMVKSLLHKKVITKATRVGRTAKIQVQDVTWTLTNKKGETFDLGFDLKFTSKDANEYKRGENVKSFTEVVDLINNPILSSQMMYLLVNSYYQQQESEAKATYNDILGSDGKKQLYGLINVVRGLYGLLPASAVDFTTTERIEGFVKSDNRMFVMVNQNILLMTDFLGQIKGNLLKFKGASGTIKGLRDGLAKILDKWGTEHEIKSGRNKEGIMYMNKLHLAKVWKFANMSGVNSNAYKYLKSYVDTSVTRSDLKDEWKFTIDNTSFQFTPRKQ